MGAFIVGVLSQALQRILGSSGNIANTDIRDAMQAVWDVFTGLGSFLSKLFGAELDAWKAAAPDIENGATGLGEVGFAESYVTQRLLNTIIPGSLRWLDGHTHQWVDLWIRNVYDNFVKWEQAEWDDQHKWDIAIVKWRSFFVDPHLRDWISFHHWFNTYPTFVIQLWWKWLNKPSDFAQWATPWIMRPFADYLESSQHKLYRDRLTQDIIDTTPDLPRHVEAAAVAVLLSEGW